MRPAGPPINKLLESWLHGRSRHHTQRAYGCRHRPVPLGGSESLFGRLPCRRIKYSAIAKSDGLTRERLSNQPGPYGIPMPLQLPSNKRPGELERIRRARRVPPPWRKIDLRISTARGGPTSHSPGQHDRSAGTRAGEHGNQPRTGLTAIRSLLSFGPENWLTAVQCAPPSSCGQIPMGWPNASSRKGAEGGVTIVGAHRSRSVLGFRERR